MNCRQLENILPELAAGELDEKIAQLATEHINACPACAAELAAFDRALGALARPRAMLEVPAGLDVLRLPEQKRVLTWVRPVFVTAALAAVMAGVVLMPRSPERVITQTPVASNPAQVEPVHPSAAAPATPVGADTPDVQNKPTKRARTPILVAVLPKGDRIHTGEPNDLHSGRAGNSGYGERESVDKEQASAEREAALDTPDGSVIVIACDIEEQPADTALYSSYSNAPASAPAEYVRTLGSADLMDSAVKSLEPTIVHIESRDEATGDTKVYDYSRDSEGNERVIEVDSNISSS